MIQNKSFVINCPEKFYNNKLKSLLEVIFKSYNIININDFTSDLYLVEPEDTIYVFHDFINRHCKNSYEVLKKSNIIHIGVIEDGDSAVFSEHISAYQEFVDPVKLIRSVGNFIQTITLAGNVFNEATNIAFDFSGERFIADAQINKDYVIKLSYFYERCVYFINKDDSLSVLYKSLLEFTKKTKKENVIKFYE